MKRSIKHNGIENTEKTLNSNNGLIKTSIPNGLKDPNYRILIVSNKYQTGFDEPLLQSMYIDKKLNGVQCVQTLSRLNRTTKGKDQVFVLDFANDTETILESFKPYFTSTVLTQETDPDRLYQILYEIEDFKIYTENNVDAFCKEFYSKSSSDEKLHPLLDVVVDNYKQYLNEEEKEAFKSKVQSFIRLYSYIAQISNFGEIKWEKSYVFLKLLNKKLPKKKSEKVSVSEFVNLDSLRIQLMGESSLVLEGDQGEVQGISGETGGGSGDEELLTLTEIIQKINDVFGSDLGEEDKVTLAQIESRMKSDETLQKVLNGNNTEDVKQEFFRNLFKETVVDYHGDRIDFYKNVMDKKVFPMLVDFMYQQVVGGIG